MIYNITETGYVLPFSLLVILATTLMYLLASRKRKLISTVPKNFQNRILKFQPEPLVDEGKKLDRLSLELLKPNELQPGTLNLASINFLNLLNNNDIKLQAEECIKTYGVGSCGPRGFYGTIDIHLSLESRLASFMGMEEAVLYSYGFSTIASAIGAYCKKSDIIFCDEEIGFSAQQGFLASKSKIVYFKHNDTKDLEDKLIEYKKKELLSNKLFRKFLIVEGICSKTGTICPLPELMKLREAYKLRIFIDETFSFGVLGKTGRGLTEHFQIDRSDVDMIMGSLEGSICSIGGFCIGASVVIEHQRLSGLGYCFSASLPPFLSHVAIYTIDLFENNKGLFEELENVCLKVDKQLNTLNSYKVISDPLSPLKVIKPLAATKEAAMKIRQYCSQKNIFFLQQEDKLLFYVNVLLNNEDIRKIISTFDEASRQF